MSHTGFERHVLPWADFKVLLLKKNITHQYIEKAADYSVWFDEEHDRYYCAIPKSDPASEDQTDYETNFKAAGNWAIGTRPYAFATGDFEFAPKAAIASCPAGESEAILIAMCGTKYMNGGELITDGKAAFGDWVKCEVVDHDNLLQQGVDFVLKTWVEKWYVDWKSCKDLIQTPYAGLPPAGMYLRLTYNSTGAEAVGFALNLLMHKAI